MRIKRIEIGGFGKWKNKVVDLDHDFQVFFGNNETGKSTIYQFIRYVLFDPSNRKNEVNDYAPRDQGLHGGRIIVSHPLHGDIKIERFKGHHKGQARVYFPDGTIAEQERLKELLAPLTLTLFDDVFSLQQEELLKIRHLDEDSLQQLLLSVGVSGSHQILKTQQDFAKKHKELYRPSGRVRPLNQELSAYRDLEKQITQKEQLEQNYRKQLKELDQLKRNQAQTEVSLAEYDVALRLLNEQERLWPDYQEYQQLSASLEYEQVEILSTEQIEELTNLEKEEQFIKEQMVEYQSLKETQLVNGQLSPALVFYQNNQLEIDNLAEQQPKFMKLQARIEWLAEKAQKEEHELNRLARTLEVKSAVELPALKQGDYNLVQKLANREANLSANLTAAEASRKALKEQLEPVFAKQTKSAKSYGSAIVAGVATAALAGAVLYLGEPVIALAILVIGVGMCLFLGLRAGKNNGPSDAEQLQKELGLVDLEVEKNQQELAKIAAKKSELAKSLVFPLRLPFTDWLYLWPQREQLRVLEASLRETRAEEERLERDGEIYREHLLMMSEWLPVKTEPLDEVYRQLVTFVKEMREKQAQLNSDNITNWHEPLKALQEREAKLPEKLAEILPDRKNLSMREIPLFLANQSWAYERQQQLENSRQQLAKVFDFTQTYDLDEIKKLAAEKSLAREKSQNKLSDLQEDIQRLNFSLRQQEADGTLSQLYQARENLGEEIKTLAREWLDNRLGEQILQDLLNFLGLQHLPRLLATASQYLKVLTLNHYQKCEFVAERLQVVSPTGEIFKVSELSTGTRDQLYLAIRLAFIHLHSQEQLAPVIIDDGWLHYDSERKLALFNLLGEFSEHNQVICLSSDEELKTFAKNKGVALEIL